MGSILSETKKHSYIYLLFIKNCIMQQMEYRTNFIVNIAVECIYVLSKMLYVVIAYQTGSNVNGISSEQVTLFVGTFMILTAVYTGFFMENFYAISEKVKKGDLDLMIIKPISLQFYTTLRSVNIALPIPNIIMGVILVCTSWRKMGIEASVVHILLYIGLLICGTILTYSIFLLPQLLSFWIIKTSAIVEITDKLWDFNNMPMSIYTKWMKRIGTFIIPIFCITNFPVMSIVDSLSVTQKIWAVIAPILFFVLIRIVWKYSIKHYSSAGG